MRNWIGSGLCALALLVGVNGWAQNPDAPKHIIHHTDGLTIDGDLSDWTGAEWITYDKDSVVDTYGTNWNDPDAVCTFSTMYDDEALYLAAEVEDDVISHVDTTTPHAWWERDGVQWFIDFTHNSEQDVILYPDILFDFEGSSHWLPGETIFAIGATQDQTVETTRRWCVGTRNGSRSDAASKTLDDGTVVQGEVNEAWEVVVNVEEGKYTIEAKVPWESLERSQYYSDPDPLPDEVIPEEMDKLGWAPLLPDPLEGGTISFTHLCIDTDLPEGGFEAQAMWVGDGDYDLNWTEATFAAPVSVQAWELH